MDTSQLPLYWYWWETFPDSGRPNMLRCALFIQGQPAYWETHSDILPFALGNYVIVSDQPLAYAEGQRLGMEMVESVDGWCYFKEGEMK